jgi:hypothetical protein
LASAVRGEQRASSGYGNVSWRVENGDMTVLRATTAHVIPERSPIQVIASQPVRRGRRDDEWPAFLFIAAEDGAGWVPERHLDTSRDPAVVITGYDTTELQTTAG